LLEKTAVRYAWKDWPDYSPANGAGLPATPPTITQAHPGAVAEALAGT